jgi:branched-chain amino acid aminotransferase
MLVCNYKDGKWSEAKISPYGPISMPPGSQVLHYG